MTTFYCVAGNRDKIKVQQADGSLVQRPIWDFLPEQRHWLTSLVYLRGMAVPPGARLIDCGAWSYKAAPEPKWSPQECAERYATVAEAGNLVAAPDHMVLRGMDAQEEAYRVDVTLTNAREFLRICPAELRPLAVTHGNSVDTRARMTSELLEMGYRHIAIGSVAIRAGNRKFIHAVLDETARLRGQQGFYVHVLGVSALSWVPVFNDYGVDSYDGSSMFFAAFTAGEYHWFDPERGKVVEYSVKEGVDPEALPACDCPVCTTMRRQGVDTRRMGSNEHNMGRAVHNIHVYRQALQALPTTAGMRQPALGLEVGTWERSER